ncbi:MAG: tetratricopeptide repeat protein [Crocinitomicaceae bacterium]|nr:tetratricopeptide repeat protein [Crocinitomicaceae bacterium]
MRKFIFSLLMFVLPIVSIAQDTDHQLAEHYYANDEFDKALIYYEKIYDREPTKPIFSRYLECLTETGDAKTAEKLLKKMVARNGNDQEYTVMLATFYENQGEPKKANDIYKDLIDNMRNSSRDIIMLYNLFKGLGKSEMAYETILKGRKLLKNSYPLNFQFAEYYGSIGETRKMIDEYLDLMDYHPTYLATVQNVMSAQIDFTKEDSEEYQILKAAIIERTQKNPEDEHYSEMLIWLFTQRRNFSAALVHIKAIDKRTGANGRKVYDFGLICVENKDFSSARRAFKYVVDLGEKSKYLMNAQNALLNVSFQEVTTRRNFSESELNQVILDYTDVLDQYGKNQYTLNVVLELAHIQAFYAQREVEAIVLLNEALELDRLTDIQKAHVKMQLGDVYVLKGDIWEASLLYMQVDKDFKYEPIGHEAKFKNARIFYYDSEFEFAQSQLDVLKQSTSKLIANDALKLSLFITDNYGLDSNYIAMSNFANADLLIEQHRYDEAFKLFDSIVSQFPAHSLGDEILIKKARAMQLTGQWNESVKYLEELLEYHGTDILADDALFQLGDIYENHLMDKTKAAEFYKKILFEHKGSLYTAETRKRYLVIRDLSNEEQLNMGITPEAP